MCESTVCVFSCMLPWGLCLEGCLRDPEGDCAQDVFGGHCGGWTFHEESMGYQGFSGKLNGSVSLSLYGGLVNFPDMCISNDWGW